MVLIGKCSARPDAAASPGGRGDHIDGPGDPALPARVDADDADGGAAGKNATPALAALRQGSASAGRLGAG